MTIRDRLLSVVSPDALFPLAIGTSAFFLFTLELASGQIVLPVFGGTPDVWATALCFFTTILFLGYLYAHIVATRLDPVRAGTVHLVVAAIAMVTLILGPREVASLRVSGLPEAVNVLLVLLITVGPATFLLASTTPLLSAWYAMHRPDAWWLYATSSGASFLALVAYPFFIAPTIGLSAQRWLIVAGVVLFGVPLSLIVIAIRGGQRAADDHFRESGETPVRTPALPRAPRPPFKRQAVWLFAAFVPAGLLTATTSYITTDLVSAPLLWVGPLAVYLLSFVIAFSSHGRRLVRLAELLVPAAAALLWIPWVAGAIWPVLAVLFVELGAFLVLAVAIHGRLAGDKPAVNHLTRFYLVIAAGGMLATAFVALIAPLLFTSVLEYPILIVAGLVVLAILPAVDAPRDDLSPVRLLKDATLRLVPYLVATAILVLFVTRGDLNAAAPLLGLLIVGGYSIAIAIWPVVLPISTAVAIVAMVVLTPSQSIYQSRSFFNVIRVVQGEDVRLEYSGSTLHGAQYDDVRRTDPTTYYISGSPISQVFDQVHATVANPTVAIVGLGVGTLAAYQRETDRFTFFEIDQRIVDIADDPRFFSYLSQTPIRPKVVVGDARLSLADQPPASFNLIVLDAFTSDSVPVHLLTREAIQSYQRVLRPGGVIAFHLTNRYYELEPAVMSTAETLGLTALATSYVPPVELGLSHSATASSWVVAGSGAAVAPFGRLGWTDRSPGPVLTDDYSDLLRTLRP